VGVKESLQKKFDRLERYAKFYLNMLLAVLSGLVWSVYASLEKIIENNSIIILEILGINYSNEFYSFKVTYY